MKLYKYQKVDVFSLGSIINNTLFFANPESFNDPFDSRLFYKSFTSKEDFIRSVMDKDLQCGGISEKDYHAFIESINDPTLATPEFLNMLLSNIQKQKRFANLRITCFSEKWNNLQMWGHYADKYKGFCLGFNIVKVENDTNKCLLPISNEHQDIFELSDGICYLPIFKVHYEREPFEAIDLTKENDTIKKYKYFLTTKESHWDYEKEWRGFISEENPKTGLIKYNISHLTDVIFGLRCEESNIIMIKRILEQQGILNKICLWKTEENEAKYKLERKKINV